MMNLVQGDCRCGSLGFAAGEDLSLAAGKLAKLNGGKDLVLPASGADVTPYVLAVGADTGYLCGAVPLCSAANARVVLSGACDAGDRLVSKGDGRVEKSAEGNAGALLIGIAEEAGIDGQHVLLRPVSVGVVGPAGADGAAGADGVAGGVFKLGTGSVTFACEASALVGKCLVYSLGTGWTGSHTGGITPEYYALVTGLAGSVLTCVFLGFAAEESRVLAVPTAMVTGGGSVGDVVFLDSAADLCAVLGNVSNLYSGETWSVLAVGDGLTLLKKCYSAM